MACHPLLQFILVVDGNINNASLINCLGQVAILTILKHSHILENFSHNHFILLLDYLGRCGGGSDDH